MNVTPSYNISFNHSLILKGHTDFIKVLTPLNKTILASGSCDNKIMLWNILTFKHIANLTGHKGCINALISVPYDYDDNLLISGSTDSTIKVWQSNGTELKGSYFESAHTEKINALAFGSIDNDEYIASASEDKTIRVWSYNYLSLEKEKLLPESIRNLKLLTVLNKTLIVTVSESNEITIWNKTKTIAFFNYSTNITAIKALSNGYLAIAATETVEIYNSNFSLIDFYFI